LYDPLRQIKINTTQRGHAYSNAQNRDAKRRTQFSGKEIWYCYHLPQPKRKSYYKNCAQHSPL